MLALSRGGRCNPAKIDASDSSNSIIVNIIQIANLTRSKSAYDCEDAIVLDWCTLIWCVDNGWWWGVIMYVCAWEWRVLLCSTFLFRWREFSFFARAEILVGKYQVHEDGKKRTVHTRQHEKRIKSQSKIQSQHLEFVLRSSMLKWTSITIQSLLMITLVIGAWITFILV